MTTPFLSSEEYDESAHQLYNEGQYDDALSMLREGLALYPNSVELHIGVGYARLAREEFAWARQSFDEALVFEPEHEDALAGLGETLLKFGHEQAGLRCFRRTLDLGYQDDIDLMLQIGRALFREASQRERVELFEESKGFFEVAVQQAPESAEAVACVGYAQHRMGEDEVAIASLRRSLQLDGDHVEARIYLANILYDRGDYDAALFHFERTTTEDHWDDVGVIRLMELKRAARSLPDHHEELAPWEARLEELSSEEDALDELLMELDEGEGHEGELSGGFKGQLEVFGTLLSSLADDRAEQLSANASVTGTHELRARDGGRFTGSWEEIVHALQTADDGGAEGSAESIDMYMARMARRVFRETGVHVAAHDAELFLRGCMAAGLFRSLQ